MPAGEPMEVRVFDATTGTLVQDWTSTGGLYADIPY